MVKPCRAALAMLAFGLVGCELESTTIPLAEPEIVVHAVLNPALGVQTFLVEESVTGKIDADDDRPFDPANPIVTGNGVPVTGAVVQLTIPDGTILTATEITRSGQPTGLYRIQTDLQPGGRYGLRIAALGKTATGSTIIPRATNATPIPPVVAFNRDRDTVKVPISAVDGARAYWIRIEAPISGFNLITTDRDIAISGETRNLFTDDLVRVFFPGFEQTMTVAAMDTNLFDYYRSGNDPFSGTGLINHLTGGLGVFGSIGVIERRILEVSQDETGDSLEGAYTLRLGGLPATPHTLRLYVESKGPSATSGDALSGYYLRGSGPPSRGAIRGTRNGTSISFDIYSPQSTTDRTNSFAGAILGDTLRVTSTATSYYVKVGK